MEKHSVGKEIVTYCSRCKLDLAHMIVAMKDEFNIHKVMCKTCKSTHGYKNKTLDKVLKKASAPRRKTTKKTQTVAEIWNESISKATKAAQTYSVRAQFTQGDLIDHPKFGTGYVEKCLDQNKIEVIFQTDIKILIHNK